MTKKANPRRGQDLRNPLMYALCSRAGVITFAPQVPVDMSLLPIARGPSRKLKERIEGVARHAYDGITLLVPGIPEAPNEAAALNALQAFRAWIKPRFERDGLTV